MLHCYRKSRHNLYEQLDYLGLNPYEQRHFCFEGAGSGEGAEGESTGGFAGMEAAAGAGKGSGAAGKGEGSGGIGDSGVPGGPGPGPGGEDEDSIGGYGAIDIQGLADLAAQQAGWAEFGGARTQDEMDVEQASFDALSNPNPSEAQFDPRGLFVPETPIDPFTATKKYKEPFRPLEMLSDPVLLAAKTNPEYKKMYDDAIRGAAQSMSSNQILGTMQQNGIRDGTGYISSLERGGFDRTWGLGIRGDFEVQAPEGMTKEQYNNYIDLFMAHDGTQAGKLRMALDEVEKDSSKTVGSIFEKENIDPGIYGLDKNMNANRVSDYMDMKAMEGIVQGFPMAMSLSNPMMISNIFGSDAIKDIITEVNENIVGTPIEDPANAAQKVLKDVKDDLTSVIPENKDIAERISELFGIPNQEYFNEKGFYNTPEPTVDDLVPENMIEASALYDPAIAMADPNIAGLPGISFNPNLPDTTGPENITDIGGLPAEDYLDPAVPEDVRRDVEIQLVPSQRPLSDADTNKLMSMMNVGLDAYNTVPPSDTLTRSTNISPDIINNTLNTVANMIQQPGSTITTTDYLAIQNATTEEEFIEAVQTVMDKDKQSGPVATAEAAFKNYRTPRSDPTLEMLRDPISSSLAEEPLTLDEAIMLSEIPPTL